MSATNPSDTVVTRTAPIAHGWQITWVSRWDSDFPGYIDITAPDGRKVRYSRDR